MTGFTVGLSSYNTFFDVYKKRCYTQTQNLDPNLDIAAILKFPFSLFSKKSKICYTVKTAHNAPPHFPKNFTSETDPPDWPPTVAPHPPRIHRCRKRVRRVRATPDGINKCAAPPHFLPAKTPRVIKAPPPPILRDSDRAPTATDRTIQGSQVREISGFSSRVALFCRAGAGEGGSVRGPREFLTGPGPRPRGTLAQFVPIWRVFGELGVAFGYSFNYFFLVLFGEWFVSINNY